jgi:hypothetical protein
LNAEDAEAAEDRRADSEAVVEAQQRIFVFFSATPCGIRVLSV